MAKPFLSVIIPVYNAANRLPVTLIDADKHLSEQEYSYEILVANDGSTDTTANTVQKFADFIKNLKLIDGPDNRGRGVAARQAMEIAKGNWRVIMDVSNLTNILEFNKMMPYLREGYEIFIGSNGPDFMCFSESAAHQIFSLTRTSRWAFNYEVLALAKALGHKIKRMSPLHKRKLTSFMGSISFTGLVRFLWEFAKIRWRLWRNKH